MKMKLTTYVTLACFLFISSVSGQQPVRVEKDLLGEKQVPADAYYGVQTARALENFKNLRLANQSLSRLRRILGHSQTCCRPGQYRCRRHETRAAGCN